MDVTRCESKNSRRARSSFVRSRARATACFQLGSPGKASGHSRASSWIFRSRSRYATTLANRSTLSHLRPSARHDFSMYAVSLTIRDARIPKPRRPPCLKWARRCRASARRRSRGIPERSSTRVVSIWRNSAVASRSNASVSSARRCHRSTLPARRSARTVSVGEPSTPVALTARFSRSPSVMRSVSRDSDELWPSASIFMGTAEPAARAADSSAAAACQFAQDRREARSVPRFDVELVEP